MVTRRRSRSRWPACAKCQCVAFTYPVVDDPHDPRAEPITNTVSGFGYVSTRGLSMPAEEA
jgi:hypothetical protein